MKTTLLGVLLFLAGMQAEQMVTPKIEHHKYETTQVEDIITRTCPANYEGHFVDKQEGFDATFPEPNISWGSGGDFSGAPVYTICFKKNFMDEVRKNPELSTNRPYIRAAEYYFSPCHVNGVYVCGQGTITTVPYTITNTTPSPCGVIVGPTNCFYPPDFHTYVIATH